MSLDRETLERLVREVVKDTLTVREIGLGSAPAEPCEDERCAPRNAPRQVPVDPHEARRVVDATPARVVQGRTGTRYLTPAYLQLRAEHAIALDAVHSSVPADWPARLGLLALKSRCQDLAEHLLYPDHGRRLDDESRARLHEQADRGVDVQLIAGDGLAAHALLLQGAELIPALATELRQVGLSVGKPLFVRHARIGVADEIGTLTGARSTVIVVGERPGLGTGDSLSIYTAFKPRLGQDNSEKNCISNIRPLGMPPAVGARECARLMRRTFDAGGGGLHLVRPRRDVVAHHG